MHAPITTMAPDAERRALEARIRAAKERLFYDLDCASDLVRGVAQTAGRRAVRVALAAGALLVAAGVLFIVRARRRRHRVRITWR